MAHLVEAVVIMETPKMKSRPSIKISGQLFEARGDPRIHALCDIRLLDFPEPILRVTREFIVA
jgi:hypothetical protein